MALLHPIPTPHARRIRPAVAFLVAAALSGSAVATLPGASAAPAGVSGDATPSAAKTLGTEFLTSKAGTVTSVRFYRTGSDRGAHAGKLWSAGGGVLGTFTFPARATAGYQSVSLDSPVHLAAGARVVAGYTTGGAYARGRLVLSPQHPIERPGISSVYSRSGAGDQMPATRGSGRHYLVGLKYTPDPTTTPPPTTPPPTTPPPTPTSAFPNAASTGVPSSVTLTNYTGPTVITRDGTVIDGKRIPDEVLIKADNVVIRNSYVDGRLSSDFGGSVTVTDSVIDGGNQETFPSVSYSHITLKRVEVIGGQHSVQCSDYCTVEDSWLHDQYLPSYSAGHVNAFISNGGHHLVLRHNTVHCTVPLTRNDGGCSGDVSFFGDFDPISDIVVDNNLFKANQVSISYCLYAGYNPGKAYGRNPTRVVVTDNVFERGANRKCGVYGPVTSFRQANGNVWSGNVWQDNAAPVAAAE